MKVSVDQEGCISCGFCVNECPDIFDFNEDDKSFVMKQPDNSEEDAVVIVPKAALCPLLP